MAIATGASASGSTASFSLNIGTAGNNRLVVISAGSETHDSVTGITVDGKTCTKIYREYHTGKNVTELWYIDENVLGASNGTVTIAWTGADTTNWRFDATVFTGVAQNGYNDYGYAQADSPASLGIALDVSEGGLVVLSVCDGSGSRTITSWTSPLEQDLGGNNPPTSAGMFSASGVESSAQSAKSYVATYSSAPNRATGVAASWDAAGAGTTYHLAGVTKDVDGNTKANCICHLWQYTSGTPVWVAYVLSDGSGNYDFTALANEDSDYFVVSFKAETPHIMDITDHAQQPVEE